MPNVEATSVDYCSFFGYDDVTSPSSEYETFNPNHKKNTPILSLPYIDDGMRRIANVISDVAAYVVSPSTKKIRILSKEDSFIERMGLQEVVRLAEVCIIDSFGLGVETSKEYCQDPEEAGIEWLDINLHFQDVKDDEVDGLIWRVDELSASFEGVVGIDKAVNVNFYLDIR